MKKKIVLAGICAIVLVRIVFASMSALANREFDSYVGIAEELDVVREYYTDDLTYDDLVGRNGKIIIEKCLWECVNEDGDGRILTDSEFNYINVSRVDGVKPGNIGMSVFLYNPDTEYEDDILYRWDYILDDK